jgi:hypothetical protein
MATSKDRGIHCLRLSPASGEDGVSISNNLEDHNLASLKMEAVRKVGCSLSNLSPSRSVQEATLVTYVQKILCSYLNQGAD